MEVRLVLAPPTFREVADRYLEDYAKLHKRSWREDQRKITANLLPVFGDCAFAEITRAQVSKLHTEIGRRAPIEANRTLEILSRMYELARDWEIIPESAPNPARRIKRFEEISRELWVKEDEMPRLLDSISRVRDGNVRIAFMLLLFTALRKHELLSLRWKDVDWSTLHFVVRRENVKTKKTHYLPITPLVEELLRSLPKSSEYVFPSKSRQGHLRRIEKSWKQVRVRAGMQDLWLHDLRRSAGSWLANDGVSLQVIQKLLNHSSLSATQIYARLQTKPVREALTTYQTKLMGGTGQTQ